MRASARHEVERRDTGSHPALDLGTPLVVERLTGNRARQARERVTRHRRAVQPGPVFRERRRRRLDGRVHAPIDVLGERAVGHRLELPCGAADEVAVGVLELDALAGYDLTDCDVPSARVCGPRATALDAEPLTGMHDCGRVGVERYHPDQRPPVAPGRQVGQHRPDVLEWGRDDSLVRDLVFVPPRSLVPRGHGPTVALGQSKRATAMATARATTDHDSARSVNSSGANSVACVIGVTVPSAWTNAPSTDSTRRRSMRAGVLSAR